MKTWPTYHDSAIALLQELISTQSFSREEAETAEILAAYLESQDIPVNRHGNNIIAQSLHYDPAKPTLLLNSHHDTVKPNKGYTNDPYEAKIENGKLYGLGSNDAGGCLVSLLIAFCHFYERSDLTHNLLYIASAEEEVSGANGIASVLPHVPVIDVAIVGEPTLMNMAIAEKGLIVYDGQIKGTSSHVAHPNTDNAVYNSISALQWIKDFQLEKESELLGPVKITCTQIHGGSQHNVVPSKVDIVIDVRVNDCYTNQEVDEILQREAPFTLKARSLRLNSSKIEKLHPLTQCGISMGCETYGSPTMSDQYALTCPSVKMGPGDSTRSHMADEYIHDHEIQEGIDGYIHLLESYLTLSI